MSNIIHYVQNCGSRTFQECPFNEVDNLVFAYLVYYNFSGIVPGPKTSGSIRLAEAGKQYLAKHGNTQRNVSAEVIRQMAAAPRYRDLPLSDYLDVFRAGSTQFAALRAELPGGTDCLMSRGADNSLTSWQESFAISYCHTPSQKLGLRWMQHVFDKYNSGDLVLCGHSKGGNTLLYAAVSCRPEIRARISAVYLNDSPGLTPGLYDPAALRELQGRIIRITPEYSLIGQLFEHSAPDRIAACSKEGIIQHEPLYWQVEEDHFVPAEGLSQKSRKLALGVNRWIASSTFTERRLFCRDFFNTARSYRTEDVLSDTAPESSMLELLKAFLLSASGTARRTAMKLAGAFYVTNVHALLKSLKQ